MKIFKLTEQNSLILNEPEVLLIKEFEDVWNSDKSVKKDKAYQIFKYIYLSEDWLSPYNGFDSLTRENYAREDSKLNNKVLDSELVIKAKRKYTEIRESNRYMRSIKALNNGIDRMQDYLNKVNFDDTVDSGARKGTLLHSPTELLRVIKDAPEMLDKVQEIIKKAEAEFKDKEEERTRGGVDKGFFTTNLQFSIDEVD